MKGRKIIMAVVVGVLLSSGYQVNAQMAGSQRCKTMMAQDMDGMRHKMMGDLMGTADLSPAMQGEIDTIKAKYHDDLQTKEAVIDAKMADLDKAWANESTTVGEINLIQDDLQALQQEYQKVKIKMNQEIGTKIGSARMKEMQDGSQRHMMHKGKCDGKLCNKKECHKKGCGGKGSGHDSMMHGPM